MHPLGFELATRESEGPQIQAFGRAAIVIF
jgi:hypothetical protein